MQVPGGSSEVLGDEGEALRTSFYWRQIPTLGVEDENFVDVHNPSGLRVILWCSA